MIGEFQGGLLERVRRRWPLKRPVRTTHGDGQTERGEGEAPGVTGYKRVWGYTDLTSSRPEQGAQD